MSKRLAETLQYRSIRVMEAIRKVADATWDLLGPFRYWP
jgi:hypothetical protein